MTTEPQLFHRLSGTTCDRSSCMKNQAVHGQGITMTEVMPADQLYLPAKNHMADGYCKHSRAAGLFSLDLAET